MAPTMSDHLVTTPAVAGTCPRCRCVILTGLAEGLRARVDPTALDPTAEVTALLAGRWTYTLTAGGLVHRDAGRIAGGTLTGPVLADHTCATGADHDADF